LFVPSFIPHYMFCLMLQMLVVPHYFLFLSLAVFVILLCCHMYALFLLLISFQQHYFMSLFLYLIQCYLVLENPHRSNYFLFHSMYRRPISYTFFRRRYKILLYIRKIAVLLP